MQLRRIERLVEEIVGAGLDPLQAIVAIGLRRHDHDRRQPRGRMFFQRPAHVEAVPAGRDQIEEHEIGRRRLTGGEHLAAGVDELHVMTFAGEQPFEKTRARFVVVGHKDRRRYHEVTHLQRTEEEGRDP